MSHAKGNIENSSNQKGDSNGRLHLGPRFPGPAAGDEWAYGSADTACSEQYSDSGRRFTGYWKDPFAKHREQGENATTQSPGRLNQQICQHSRAMIYVTDAFKRFGYAQSLSDGQLRLGPP